MTPAPPEPGSLPAEPAPPRRRARSLVGSVVGLALLGAAVYALRGQTSALRHAWETLRGADPVVWMLLPALPAASCLISAEAFFLLTRRFSPAGVRLPRREMFALIASAWLFNFLPLRPGLVGRIAYHKAYHGIPVRHSARVVLEAAGCGAAALALLTLAVLAQPVLGPAPLMALLAFAPFLYFSTFLSRRDEGAPGVRAILAVVALKLIDSFLWSGRYMLAFHLAGRPIGLAEGAALAVVGQAAMLIPLAGNGLGLREWAIGLVAASLPEQFGPPGAAPGPATGAPGSTGTLALAVSADLINRAAELAVAIPLGLAASAYLAHRTAKRPPDADTV